MQSSYSQSYSQQNLTSDIHIHQSILERPKDNLILVDAAKKPETEMTFGDFTESELETRNLAKRVNDIKNKYNDLYDK